MTRIGTLISGGYIDRGYAVGVIVAEHEHRVEWMVEGEYSTRIMLTRVADERVITPRASIPYPQTYREPSLARRLAMQ